MRADESKLMIRKLISECSEPVNLNSVFHDEVIVNVMMRMISGKRFFDGDIAMEEEGQRFKEIVKETFRIGGAFNIGDHLPFLGWLGMKGLENKLISLQKIRSKFFQELIDQLKKEEDKNTMIHVLLHLQESDPEYYTDEMITSIYQTI